MQIVNLRVKILFCNKGLECMKNRNNNQNKIFQIYWHSFRSLFKRLKNKKLGKKNKKNNVFL